MNISWTEKYLTSEELILRQVFRGTILDAPDFDPSADAETLYNAMKGIGEYFLFLFQLTSLFMTFVEYVALCLSGSDKDAILDLVTSRSNAQRQEVIAAYKCNFGKVWHI